MAVEYTLSMPEPHTHLFQVEVRVPSSEGPLELVLPSWTPGSYLLREFPRHVQDFEVHDSSGLRLAWRKTDKNSWRVEGEVTGGVIARYRVYANELTVRTSHLDASHGYVNGASVFMFVRGMQGETARVRLVVPEGWRIATSLREEGDGSFRADDYDELVDCPIEIGPHRTIAWEQEGIPHRYAIWGDGELDEEQLLVDTRRIVSVCSGIFGGLPYDRYLFIVHVAPNGRGGLEHRTSTSLLVSPSWLAGEDYEKLIALVAHEFFHVWLGKRIRPEPLGPFDYCSENYTRNLWVVEGFTTYFTDLILLRAGLMTPERYLERLGDSIARLQALPGRHHQSLEESSFDAWIRFYRPDAHTPNAQVSYYHKGSLVALAIDLEIRRASGGERSLDDVLRVLWERWLEADVGFPEDGPGGIQEVVESVYGGSLDSLFERYVRGTAEIDFDEVLQAAGLVLVAGDEPGRPQSTPERAADRDRAGRADETVAPTAEGVGTPRPGPRIPAPGPHEGRLGIRLTEAGGRVKVTHVMAGTPAYEAGVNAADELVAVDGVRVTPAELGARLRDAEEGDALRLTLLRRDRLVTVEARLGPELARRARIVAAPTATAAQVAVRAAWLGRGRRPE
ncbi:MAG: PDZ domain-containing protein [Gemmatimonadota bacterium]